MHIVGFICFNVPFIFDMLTVHFVVKIAASAKTVGNIIFHEELSSSYFPDLKDRCC